MKRIDVSRILAGEMFPEDFSRIYGDEISRHYGLLNKGGASAPIMLEGEQYIFVNRTNLRRALDYFLAARLNKEEIGYLLDALSLDVKTRFTDAALREGVMDLSDSGFSQEDVNEFVGTVLNGAGGT